MADSRARRIAARISVAAAAALAVAATAGLAALAAQPQTPIVGKSEVSYVATQIGVQVEGNFSRFGGRIELDPKSPQTGSVSFWVDTASVQFPSSEVVAELAKPDWFDSAHFPKSEFRSAAIRALGSNRFEVAGALTIKGRTRQATVPVQLDSAGATPVASGTLAVKRLDFGVGGGEWGDTSVVEDEVKIKFRIALGASG